MTLLILFPLTTTGAIREYMVSKVGICNPPDLTASIPVDIRGLNDESSTDPIPGYPVPSACSSSTSAPLSPEGPGVSFVLLTSPLPTNTEGKQIKRVNHTARCIFFEEQELTRRT